MNLHLRMHVPVVLITLLAPCIVLAQTTSTGSGQPYPAKIVHVVVPWPGGSNDAVARISGLASSWSPDIRLS